MSRPTDPRDASVLQDFLGTVRAIAPAAVLVASAAACAGLQPASRAPSPEQIPELRDQVDRNPGSVDARVRLGAAYREADSLDRAREVLTEARSRDPDHPRAVLFLGLTYEDLEAYSRAQELYREYLRASDDPELGERIERRLAYVERQQLKASMKEALEREEELADRSPPENTVAVFPFLYRGQQERFRPLGRALASFLVTDLSRSDRITVLERMRVQLLLQEMQLSETEYVDPATAARSGRLLGTSRVVQGLLRGGEQQLEVETSVLEAAEPPPGGTLDPIFTGQRPAERILDLQAEIAFSVFRSLDVELTPAERERIRDRPTENLRALLAFGRGLLDEDSGNFTAAARHYERAAELDPDFGEARERAQRATNLSAAAAESTDQLAQAAFETGGAVAEGVTETQAVTPAATSEDVSSGLGRDPVAEVLGVEGVSESTAFLRILIPPPGGDGQ